MLLEAADKLRAAVGVTGATEVLERVLSQLESAALFTEESCSFSQGDMVDALGDWLARARAL